MSLVRSRLGTLRFVAPALAGVLSLLLFPASPAAQGEEGAGGISPGGPAAAGVSATYAGDDGTEVSLYRDAGEDAWVLTYARPREDSMTLFLDGQPSDLAPVGMAATVRFNGRNVAISAGRDGVYGVAGTGEGQLECLVGYGGGTRTYAEGSSAAGGEPSPEEMEAAMMMQDVARNWEIMKGSRVVVDGNTLRIRNAGEAEDIYKELDRRASLSKRDVEMMKQQMAARAAALASARAFVERELKLEDKP